MSDHFGVIGFKAGSAEELAGLLATLPETGADPRACGPGYYYRWQSDAGPELWIHMQREAAAASTENSEERLTIVGVTPFFSGEGRVTVRVMTLRQRPTDNAFEGAAFAEIEPGPKPHQCATVALFDLIDYACETDRQTPFIASAQIAAFPHDIAVFVDESAFNASQQGQDVKFAAKSFFASGLFAPLGDDPEGAPTYHDPDGPDFRAPAKAYLTGVIAKSETRRNSVTGQSFRWALINTLGGAMDVVASESQFRGDLRPGMIVQGEFWLCGRLTDEAVQLGLPGLL
ncbi:MAG: hypothetical protein SGJ17_00200 [Hyphomicrobiales bacterium]|mgnify:CR=1 FL=1|nr:hypothetical protein [Hyphomicrobiales bacterium]